MKTKIAIFSLIAVALLVSCVSAGNGATENGKHFNLNLIGVKDISTKPGPTEDDTNGGARIFIPLTGRSVIKLQEGPTFNVMDYVANADGAKFMLPAPDSLYDGADPNEYLGPGDYKVFARVVGKHGGDIDMATCAEYTYVDGSGATVTETVCSTEQVINLGKSSKFTDVTKALTTVCGYYDLDPKVDCYDIFDDMFENYFWSLDNNNAKVVQLRFYPI